MNDESHDLYLRAYTQQVDKKPFSRSRRNDEPKWTEYVLVLDCESRITPDLTLTFGFYRFCELRSDAYVCTEEGIFHNDQLNAEEFNLLSEYARATKPDTTPDGCDRLRLYSRSEFVRETLGIAIQAGALFVFFNAGFDLSRLAVDWGTAANGGWSLILSQWPNPETGITETNQYFPRIIVKALNSKSSIINSTRPPTGKPKKKGGKVKLWPSARFLDLRTLLWALRNKSYSLASACEELGLPPKSNHQPSGEVTLEEIEYCRQDVRVTTAVLNAVKPEFDLHPIKPGPDRMFSPASVAKSYLEELNISYPREKVRV